MSRKILYTILIFIILILSLVFVNNRKLNTQEYINNQLNDHYAILTHIVLDIERYCNRDYFNGEEIYIGRLLETSRDFEIAISRYENAYYKTIKNNDNSTWEIRKLIENYYNLFVDAVSLINEIDYNTLEMIKNDFEKWISWIEENYIYIDKDGHYAYKLYTYDDMVESGLIDELKLANIKKSVPL